MTSSSGPVVVAQNSSSNVIIQACAVHSGAQGGILAVDEARLSLHQSHCYDNSAMGLELRDDAFALLEGCHFYNNGRQGIVSWKGAGKLTAKYCCIHSHPNESGVLVCNAQASFHSCRIYDNNLAGAVIEDKGGVLRMIECEIDNNNEGILIQSFGSAYIKECKIHSNKANGIFIGFDHRGSAVIVKNEVYGNRSKGILIGNNRSINVSENIEYSNLGLPPLLPNNVNPQACKVTRKYLKRTGRNRTHIHKAMRDSNPQSFLHNIMKKSFEETHDEVMDMLDTYLTMCAFCKKLPPKDEVFSKCSRCKNVSYCSRECQKRDWSEHKKICHDKSVKYPSFIDKNVSV